MVGCSHRHGSWHLVGIWQAPSSLPPVWPPYQVSASLSVGLPTCAAGVAQGSSPPRRSFHRGPLHLGRGSVVYLIWTSASVRDVSRQPQLLSTGWAGSSAPGPSGPEWTMDETARQGLGADQQPHAVVHLADALHSGFQGEAGAPSRDSSGHVARAHTHPQRTVRSATLRAEETRLLRHLERGALLPQIFSGHPMALPPTCVAISPTYSMR